MKMFRSLLMAGFLLTSTVAVACNQNQNGSQDKTKTEQGIKHIDAATFREKVWDYKETPNKFDFKGQRPVILDFYASWCGPCRSLSPKLEKIAKKYAGKIDFYKINVDDESALARVFSVRSIPMVLFVPVKGQPIQTLGDLSEEQIEESIKQMNSSK